MNTMVTKPMATHLHFDDDAMWVELADGRQLGVPLVYFPQLLNASPEQRSNFSFSGGGTGIHWDSLDEDISVPSLLMGIGDQTRRNRSKRMANNTSEGICR